MPVNTSSGTDSEKVDQATQSIAAGDLKTAKRILSSVITNAPLKYSHQTEEDNGSLTIRFWDQAEFVHFVTWKKPSKSIQWVVSVYPRAYFYLGFIAVAERDYHTAIDYLDRGAVLEPTNPKFKLEKAQALAGLKKYPEAFAIYNQVSEVGPFVQSTDVARALRGKGFVLIEMGRVAEAEDALKASLSFEPGSKVAQDELRYIAQLRANGGRGSLKTVVTSSGKDLRLCIVCGKKLTSGTIVTVDGSEGLVCEVCKTKSTKKAWQFWK